MRTQDFLKVCIYGCLLLAATPTMVPGQGGKGGVRGVVSDTAGLPIPGVEVTVTHLARNQVFSIITGSVGRYQIDALPIGEYRLSASVPGFKSVVHEKVVVQTATSTTVDVTLEVGEISDEVTVEGTEIALNTTNAEIGTVMEDKVLEELPLALNGARRQAESFVLLTPGVTGNVNRKSINGGQGWSDEVGFDGSTSTTLWIPGYSTNLSPPYEAVGEFKVHNTLMPVEYGRGFGNVELALKSGNNEFHGSVFDFLRNDKLDARSFFARERPIVRQNEFGGSLGGPIIKDRTFFFFSYAGFERRGGAASASLVTLPTQKMRGGDFSEWPFPIFDPATTRPDGAGGLVRDQFPNNVIPQSRFDPNAIPLASLLPPLDIPGQPFNNFVNRSQRPASEYTWSIKVDHKISDSNHIAFTFWDVNRDEDRFGAVPGELDTLVVFRTDSTPLRFNWDSSLSSTLLNHLTVGYTYLKPNEQQRDARNGASVFQIPNLPADGPGIPTFRITGQPAYGNASGMPVEKDTDNLNFVENVTWIRGDHQFKFGVEVLRKSIHWVQGRNQLGTYGFRNLSTSQPNESFSTWGSSWASFLLGQVFNTERRIAASDRTFHEHILTLYGEDVFQLSPKLTVTLGLRYDMPWYLREAEDQVSSLDVNAPNPGAGGIPGALVLFGNGPGRAGDIDSIVGEDYRSAFSPRLGLAYRLSDKTVLRAGYGLFHFFANAQRIGHGVVHEQGFSPLPAFASTDQGITPAFILSEGFPINESGIEIPNTDPAQTNNGPIDYANPSGGLSAINQSWTLSVQRGVTSSVFLELAYVGNKNDRITAGLEDINQVAPSYLSLGSLLLANINSSAAIAAGIEKPYPSFNGSVAQALRPFPQFTDIRNNQQPTGYNQYHALQVRLQKRFSGGNSFLTSYTLSKSLGAAQHNTFSDAFAGSGGARFRALNTFNRDLEKAHTALDQTHVLVMSGIYELPFGHGRRFGSGWNGTVNNILGGWQLQAILRYQSAPTLSVTGGPVLPGFSGGNRPLWVSSNVRSSVGIGDFDPAVDRYLNIGAFEAPAPFTIGNAPRRIPHVRAPFLLNEDVSLIKKIYVGEQVQVHLRGEFFNLFNRHIFNAPASNFNNPRTFGRIRRVGAGRSIQLGLRVAF